MTFSKPIYGRFLWQRANWSKFGMRHRLLRRSLINPGPNKIVSTEETQPCIYGNMFPQPSSGWEPILKQISSNWNPAGDDIISEKYPKTLDQTKRGVCHRPLHAGGNRTRNKATINSAATPAAVIWTGVCLIYTVVELLLSLKIVAAKVALKDVLFATQWGVSRNAEPEPTCSSERHFLALYDE